MIPEPVTRDSPPAKIGFLSLSGILLIFVNLLPLGGAIFLDWKIFPIMLLYWFENIVIGIFNVLRILCVSSAGLVQRIFSAMFFMVHYGLFTLAHGAFLIVLFAPPELAQFYLTHHDPVHIILSLENEYLFAVVLLIFSHGFSFYWNYLLQGEYRRANVDQLMSQPYRRIVILHLTLIFSGFFLVQGGQPPVWGLVLLTVLKLLLDVFSHQREHEKLRAVSAE